MPIYFFLVARNRSKLDKNVHVDDPAFRQLVKKIASLHNTGLHPSWASGDRPALLTGEKDVLESIIGRKVTASRQHFIRFHLPVTYRRLLALGITDDYSMGYGTINGFRASVAGNFYWYDLKKEKATPLCIHPFCFMDANAYYEQKLSPEGAAQQLAGYLETLKQYGGTLGMVWHNSFLGTSERFKGWRTVYENFIRKAVSI